MVDGPNAGNAYGFWPYRLAAASKYSATQHAAAVIPTVTAPTRTESWVIHRRYAHSGSAARGCHSPARRFDA